MREGGVDGREGHSGEDVMEGDERRGISVGYIGTARMMSGRDTRTRGKCR